MLFFKCHKQKNKAKIVDGKLILSLPSAVDPVVWQMDLNEAKSSALEVSTKKELSSLILKTPESDTIIIATFQDRDHAIDSLMAASKALENAHGRISAPIANNNGGNTVTYTHKNSSLLKKAITSLGILAILFVLYTIFIMITGIGMPRPTNINTPTNAPASESSGVPMSADDFLKGR